jgi:hypothetical protein
MKMKQLLQVDQEEDAEAILDEEATLDEDPNVREIIDFFFFNKNLIIINKM